MERDTESLPRDESYQQLIRQELRRSRTYWYNVDSQELITQDNTCEWRFLTSLEQATALVYGVTGDTWVPLKDNFGQSVIE